MTLKSVKICQGYYNIQINQNIHSALTTKVGWDSPQDMKKSENISTIGISVSEKLAPKRHKMPLMTVEHLKAT